ncbi:MAG: hypothetical protein KDB52_01205 [Solirubrobacterales bacterium]|nr:hypothetical protein [Solirubrobacterales bacterium]
MAEEPERNMLFDLRGRRKRVIQVIYVILAIIMAASLVVIGLPGGVNPFGNSANSGSSDIAKANIERAEDLQAKLQTQPNNEKAAVELIRARFSAGQSLYDTDPNTGQTSITDEATTQLELAAETWARYLKMTGNKPDPEVAQLMSQVMFTLSQGSTVAQFQANIKAAAKAQQFVADDAVEQQKKGGASAASQLTTLAIYQLYAQDFEAAEKTRDQALAATQDKDEKEQINQTFKATEKDAKQVGKQIDAAIKQARKDGGKSLENPLGSLGSDTSVGGAGTGTTTP